MVVYRSYEIGPSIRTVDFQSTAYGNKPSESVYEGGRGHVLWHLNMNSSQSTMQTGQMGSL